MDGKKEKKGVTVNASLYGMPGAFNPVQKSINAVFAKPMPSGFQIISVLCVYFDVHELTVIDWIKKTDFEKIKTELSI